MSTTRLGARTFAVLASCLVFAGGAATAPAGAAPGEVTQFFVGGIPTDITAGADGNLWFTDSIANQIVKMTPAGELTRYPIPTFFSGPASITAGPDGNLWFGEVNGNKIGRITPDGVITEFPAPTPVAGLYGGLTTASDGNIWFVEGNVQKLGRITPAGVITEFTGIEALHLASGPDGNLWTVSQFSTRIGRVTTSGAATFFIPPISGSTGGDVTDGPDGNIWFTYILSGQGHVGKMSTSGTFLAGYPFLTRTSSLAITDGPDGNLWAGLWDFSKVARITPSGQVTEYVVGGARISGITTGPDGNVWFASRDGWVGHIDVGVTDTTPPTITTPSPITVNATGANGATVSYVVTASDDTDQSPAIACQPPSGSTFAIGTTLIECVAIDASGNQASASFEVHVLGATEQLAELYETVRTLGPGTSLADKVRQTQEYLAANRLSDAIAKLDNFISEVRAQSGKRIAPAVATSLIADALRIKTIIAG